MKSFFKFIVQLIVIFFLVNIAQDIVYWTINKIQEPYRVELEEINQQLEELELLLETQIEP